MDEQEYPVVVAADRPGKVDGAAQRLVVDGAAVGIPELAVRRNPSRPAWA